MTSYRKNWTPSNWASLKPFGIGEQRPNNYTELFRAYRENRDELGFAWRILNEGVCDGCALGTSGMTDWTLKGVHLCNIRLRLLRLNTMPALGEAVLGDVGALREKSSAQLRNLGRLPYPMIRRRAEAGFTRVTWDEALDAIAEKIRATTPERVGFYVTSRGMPNESYYCVQKAARAMSTNNIDNAARICHSPSTVALKAAVGAAATTCSYVDWLESDLIVFFGSNIANNQPVATKYLHFAKKNGARVVVVNAYREPGMERYWIPSLPESALFGTKLADRFHLINTGSDVAFINGVVKALIERGLVDDEFIAKHTEGFDVLRDQLSASEWEDLEASSGVGRDEMIELAEAVGKAKRAVFVWSMGITQHEHGVSNVAAICNLALTGGHVGRNGTGLMPIRGHSGVQGGAEMGAYSTAFPGGLTITAESAEALGEQWGFEVPSSPGITAPEMIDAAARDELDVLFSIGGNFLEVLPDPKFVESAMKKLPLRVHMDIVLSSQMLVDTDDTVVLLPASTRYETAGGVTQTSTERRVMFSPEIEGRRIGEARPEWEVALDLARRVRPEHAERLTFDDTDAVREEIARIVPKYDGIQHLSKKGDQFQYGGRHLCADWVFDTADGKAHFVPVTARADTRADDEFLVTTRRGKQFNSMVHEVGDALTGARRNAVFMSKKDATRLGYRMGDPVVLRNEFGSYSGTVFIAPVKSGNLQIHWPEGNSLLDARKRSPEAGVPDYNATVRLEK